MRKANTYRYITLAAMALTFAACSQDEDFDPQTDSDAVHINATIGILPQTRLAYGDGDVYGEEATTFTEGDQIRVQNTKRTTKNIATYKLDADEKTWTIADGALVWNGSSTNQFQAWYPANEKASYGSFKLPTDQSSDVLLAAADWMTASTDEMAKPTDGTINLAFRHLLTMVTIKISMWGTEYPATEQSISDVKIHTITTSIGKDNEGNAVNNDKSSTGITPLYKQVSGTISYTAIVCPGKYAGDDEVMTLTVNDQDNLTVFALGNKELTDYGLQPGKHYTFHLKVGKNKLTLIHTTTDNLPGRWKNDSEVDLN
ncbi:MAG: fimbrillin family protein [Bacteroidaceae bacterium]|nr:fimbrillin family protein [Bacteroidaceae bacterium]